jgi:hypothetical protein
MYISFLRIKKEIYKHFEKWFDFLDLFIVQCLWDQNGKSADFEEIWLGCTLVTQTKQVKRWAIHLKNCSCQRVLKIEFLEHFWSWRILEFWKSWPKLEVGRFWLLRYQNENKNNISEKAPWLQALMCTVLSPEFFGGLGPGLNPKAKGLVWNKDKQLIWFTHHPHKLLDSSKVPSR